MNNYKILRINSLIKNHRIKFFGLWLLSFFNKRYLSLQFDPVLACNLRCKMCYFTDAEYVKTNMKGIFKPEDLDVLAKTFFRNALKLQIGCGAEPTLFKHNVELIVLAKQHKVPYISMVTNGNLLDKETIENLAKAGLDEFILSMHGVRQGSYENFMDKGSYQKFVEILEIITATKKIAPKLKLRINYTFNEDNFMELADFFSIFKNISIDVIQLRPIDKIGETAYNNFSLKQIEEEYPKIVEIMKSESEKRNITLLYPTSIRRNETKSLKVSNKNDSSYLIPYTYCYLSPKFYWKEDFQWKTDTMQSWKNRNNWDTKIFRNIFKSKKQLDKTDRNMLNYEVEIN